MVHAFNSTLGRERQVDLLSSRPACSIELDSGQPGVHKETLSQSKQTKIYTQRETKSAGSNISEGIPAPKYMNLPEGVKKAG